MSWARLDDNLHDHPKVTGLSLPAIGLWTVCLTWAHRNVNQCRQPGHIPTGTARRFAGSKVNRLAEELVDAGMWEVAEGGWLIHDFTEYLAPDRERTTPGTSSELSAKRRRAGSKGGRAAQQAKQKGRANKQVAGEQTEQVLVTPVVASNEATPGPEVPKPTVSARPPNDEVANPDTTQVILGEWIQRCPNRPPSELIGRASQSIKRMLTDGIHPDDVRRGMAAWHAKGLTSASSLPGVVHEVMNFPGAVSRRQQETDAQFERQMLSALAEMESP